MSFATTASLCGIVCILPVVIPRGATKPTCAVAVAASILALLTNDPSVAIASIALAGVAFTC